jgi:hypothetical protein
MPPAVIVVVCFGDGAVLIVIVASLSMPPAWCWKLLLLTVPV